MIDSDFKEIEKFRKSFEQLQKDMPSIISRYAVAEGVYFVRKAKEATNNKKKVATSNYLRSWGSDKKPYISGNTYIIGVGNTADYALYLEKGFRAHFVPGRWINKRFVYDKEAKTGMFVGGKKGNVVRGNWIMLLAKKQTEQTQEKRLKSKCLSELRKRFGVFR